MNFKHKAVDEFALIRRYFARPGHAPGVSTGIGDDGAVLQPEPDRELVVVIDTLVAGVHFPEGIDPFDIAYRAVAVNLSDIAAMGGRPRWMTLALTMPGADEHWLERFAEGLHAAALEHAVSLVGGDTCYGKTLVISVQITGDVPRGQALLRSGARVGDHIYVTGTVGDAAAGLELLSSGTPDRELSARFLRPNARLACGQALRGVATAAIDLSDGLFADLTKLLDASGVGGVHADAVAQKRPAGALPRRVDGEDRQLLVGKIAQKAAHQFVGQGTLAGAARPGNAEHRHGLRQVADLSEKFFHLRRPLL
jgi:thiamine-monophosphate kinase